MDQSVASDGFCDESREEVAQRLVQQLLLGNEDARDEAVVLVNAKQIDNGNAGPWIQALANLLNQSTRLDELEKKFDETLLREKLASMRELAYGASHEINNPLANISSRAQTLLRDETDPERRKKLATINSQAFRAFEMIADLMLYAKPPDLERSETNLSNVVAEVMQELSEQAELQGTTLVVTGTNEDCWLNADATHLAVALKALCRNSLEAVAAGGQITVSLVSHGEVNELSVTDTGPGMTDEVREHLFDPFYSGREAGRGLGFGLSKCWRVVELHGGTMTVSGSDRKRTCFTIRLPMLANTTSRVSSPLVA